MNKILLILFLIVGNVIAGWMNVDSINIKQKWRNKKLNTDAVLFVKSSDSLMDTTNIYCINDSIGIGTNTPAALLHVNGNIMLPNGDSLGIVSQAGLIKLDQYEMDLSGLFINRGDYYITQDNGSYMSAWKLFNVYQGTQALPILRFGVPTDSVAVPGDPTTISYDNFISISALYQNVGIGLDLADSDYKLQVNGDVNIQGYLLLNDSLRVWEETFLNDTLHMGSSIDMQGYSISYTGQFNEGLTFHADNTAVFTNLAEINDENRATLVLQDRNSVSEGVGGGIRFEGYYTGTTYQAFAGINSYKSNSVDGNLGGGLRFQTSDMSGNLNTRMSIDSIGKVGIGITLPDGKLHVHSATAGTITPSTSADELIIENNANSGLTILSPDANYSSVFFGSPSHSAGGAISWKFNDSTMLISTTTDANIIFRHDDNVESMRIDGDGRIIMGTANTDSDSKLTVNGPVTFAVSSTTDYKTQLEVSTGLSYLNSNMYYSGGWQLYDINRAPCSMRLYSGDADSYISFYTHNANNTSISERMIINKNGNIGIGTSSPQYKLHVNGNCRIVGQHGIANAVTSPTQDWLWYLDGSALGLKDEINGVYPVFIYDNCGSGLLNLRSNAVGIGATNPTSAKLEVNSGTLDAVALFESTDANAKVVIKDNDRTYNIVTQNDLLSLGVNGSYAGFSGNLNIDTTGYVGIGKTDPNYSLEVNSGTNDIVAHFYSTDANGKVAISDNGTYSAGSVAIGAIADNMAFYTGLGANHMFLDENGNLGIGTTTPSADLTIAHGADTTKLWAMQYERESVATMNLRGGLNDPDMEQIGTTTLYQPAFAGTVNIEEVFGTMRYKAAMVKDTIWPYISYAPRTSGAGNFKFHLYYNSLTIGDIITTVDSLTVTVAAPGTAYETGFAFFGPLIVASTDAGFLFRLFRDFADAADTYTDDVFVASFGFEYKVNRLGGQTAIHP